MKDEHSLVKHAATAAAATRVGAKASPYRSKKEVPVKTVMSSTNVRNLSSLHGDMEKVAKEWKPAYNTIRDVETLREIARAQKELDRCKKVVENGGALDADMKHCKALIARAQQIEEAIKMVDERLAQAKARKEKWLSDLSEKEREETVKRMWPHEWARTQQDKPNATKPKKRTHGSPGSPKSRICSIFL